MGIENPEEMTKEIINTIVQAENSFVERLRNHYNNESTEIMKTVRLPMQLYTETIDWDIELTNIIHSLRR